MDILDLHFDIIAVSLSPIQKWQAARWFNHGVFGDDTFILICGVILAFLMLLFIIVTLLGSIKRKRNSNKLFIEYADNRGLNIRERHVLMDIAIKSKLKAAESIYTMSDVFDRGSTQMVRATLAKHGAKRSEYIRAELSILREKLGFRKKASVSDLAIRSDKPDSRQIPEGRKIFITSLDTSDYFEAETIVIENNELELVIQLEKPLDCEIGDSLCVRYYFGTPIWEFDTTITRISDNTLALRHSDKIRYVNRRRFLRVAVNEPAYIAAFPFIMNISGNAKVKQEEENNSSDYVWGPPEFIPANVTELAGPGLRLITQKEVKTGDRVAVILKINCETQRDFEQTGYSKNHNSQSSKIFEDIGIVRHSMPIKNGFSIAVELTGLSESNISEMVKATNEVSIRKHRIKDISSINKEKSNNWEYISETIVN